MTGKPPLYYTFGNHMHWVDMQWLWGYHVLPGSVDDMLRLIDETGARGNVNFDAVGYEKMAVECPEHLARLRDAVARGLVEPVGCSYGQPYGLFHGGESNIRQLTYGVRTTRRLLGVRPRTFWEEEFYFFPQLPQMLAQCGYTGASLFFQWTWHTPEVPKEPCSLILWEGADSTRLPTLPRNELNVHQWPEDFDGLLDKAGAWANPAVVQWLELMPSKDWMCRSEVLLPRLRELMKDERFDVRPRTAGKLIEELLAKEPTPPVKRYAMDDVWHGMTLGKNGDYFLRFARAREEQLVSAEAYAAVASLFGRPYAQWDVYPTWELEEAWRELLAGQHHDNHECEGLCGHIGRESIRRADELGEQVLDRCKDHLADGSRGGSDRAIAFNPAGFTRDIDFYEPDGTRYLVVRSVPPFGYAAIESTAFAAAEIQAAHVIRSGNEIVLTRGGVRIVMDKARGLITQVITPEFPFGLLSAERPFGVLEMHTNEGVVTFDDCSFEIKVEEESHDQKVAFTRYSNRGVGWVEITISISGADHAVRITFEADNLRAEHGGINGGLFTSFEPELLRLSRIADSPFNFSRTSAEGGGKRKYPTGDWMTSPQVFETITNACTANRAIDLIEPQSGLGVLISHRGNQQFIAVPHGVRALLWSYDPWDENQYRDDCNAAIELRTHGPIENSQRARLAQSDWVGGTPELSSKAGGDLPPVFGPLSVENAPNVLAHAFFRESMKSGEHLPHWAGHRMFEASGGLCDHPFVIRLVEWDGQPAEVTLKLAGPVAMAAKANLLGEVLSECPRGVGVGPAGWSPLDTGWLECSPCDPPPWAIVGGKPIELRGKPIEWTQVRFAMRPREIATIYADMVMGRKQFRDLDAKREVWATVHKEPGKKE
ncbi:MAG: hypothetical protein U0638_00420 [Phycisphaerales bacterium]